MRVNKGRRILFSNLERGRFYQKGTQLDIPVYFDQDAESWFSENAKIKRVELQILINELLFLVIQEVLEKPVEYR